jgi:hypothetical protein
MNLPFFFRQRRYLTWSVLILLISGIFISGYFYYFIPRNRDATNKNGFIILHTIAASIEGKSSSHLKLFNNFHTTAENDSLIKSLLGKNNLIKNLFASNNIDATVSSHFSGESTEEKPKRGGQLALSDSVTYLKGITRSYLVNVIKKSKADTIEISESLSSFLLPLLVSQKKELFKSYMLLKLEEDKKGHPIYEDPEVSTVSSFMVDSLLTKSTKGILDIVVEGSPYKIFFYAFYVGAHQLVLCGFVNKQEYDATLDNIPFSFIFSIAVAFLLVLVLLPVLKFYIMDSNEVVGITDFFLFSLSVFIAVSLITLMVIQYLLWKGEEKQVADNLKKISKQVDSRFRYQLITNYNKLNLLDTGFAQAYSSIDRDSLDQKRINIVFDSITKARSIKTDSFYNVTWTGKSGKQLVKVDPKNPRPVLADVSIRKYFQNIKNNETFFLPDGSGRKFTWEAVYSIANSEFTIPMAKSSKWRFRYGKDSVFMVSLSTKMHPIVYPLLPAGYGFCIIDKDGNVQIHSDRNRNLRENLFEKMEYPKEIQKAVAANQERDFNEVNFYGKQHLLHIKPIPDQPFSLVTFYDKGYIIPVNMRIFIFSLVFCSISFLITAGLSLAFMRKCFFHYPLLYSFKDSLGWIIPQEKEALFYYRGFLFLTVYALIILLFLLLFPQISYVGFTLVLFTPLNLFAALFLIRNAVLHPISTLRWKELTRVQKKVWYVIGAHLFISLLYYFYTWLIHFPVTYHFLLFQGLLNALMVVHVLWKNTSRFNFNKSPIKSYVANYSWMITALIICLSGLPAIVYSWYAHKQEIIQSVKKQQIYMRSGMNERRKSVGGAIINRSDSLNSAASNLNWVYTIYSDSIRWRDSGSFHTGRWDNNEKFYFTITDKVANSYYYDDPPLYPSLPDSASDGAWYSKIKNDSLHFWSKSTRRHGTFMHIISKMPNYYLLNPEGSEKWLQAVWRLLFASFLIWVVYKWIRINVDLIFLRKYLYKAPANSKDSLINQFYAATNGAVKANSSKVEELDWADCNGDLSDAEKKIVDEGKEYEKLYDDIWEKCSEKERYLLFDFAQDGLMNHKNTSEITGLIKKGVLVVDEDYIRFFRPSFRTYLLTTKNKDEFSDLRKTFHKNSSWKAFQVPLLILLLCIAVFIFFTQEAMFKQIIALVAGISGVVSFLPKVFTGFQDKKQE